MEHLSFLQRWRSHVVRERQWRSVLASGIAALILLPALPVSAALTHYTDVESGAWYEQSAASLLGIGALSSTEARLRPGNLATRAEVAKLLVDLHNRALEYPATPSFSDVPRTAWYFPYVEAAAKAGWMRGDNNCYGQGLSRCTARPSDPVNRAEMSALLQRSFGLAYLNAAPRFPDVQSGQWYFVPVQTAADHCILQGDGGTGLVRPAAYMNRAEMIVMFDRARMNLKYGEDCGVQPEPVGAISSVSTVSADTIRVTFNVDLDPNRMDDLDRYMLERTGNGSDVDITGMTVINARIVELELASALSMDAQYRLTVTNMRTQRGAIFSDTETFTSDEGVEPVSDLSLQSVTSLSATRLRLVFSDDLNETSAEDESNFRVTDVSGDLDVGTATLTSSNTVELTLGTSLQNQQRYTVLVDDLTATSGAVFTGSGEIVYNSSSAQMVVTLNGSNQVPSVSTSATGTGFLTLTSTGLQYDITVKGMDNVSITGAHFHRGGAGTNGPVIESITFTNLRSTGTWTNLTAQERDDILDGRVYVNVHTVVYPDGEIRGQVLSQ